MNAISRSLCSFWNSSIGKKLVVAVTGLALVLFLAGHLSGNLLIFAGPEAFDEYAAFLHHALHGVGIWIARAGLLACVTLHVIATVQLTRANKAARPPYAHEGTIQATRSSRIMIWSGLTILAFVIYHLLHFTVRVDSELANLAKISPHAMVIKGFQSPIVVIFYIIAMSLLCSHLSHGVQSMFQTLGLRSKKSRPLISAISKGYALIIWVGFISIPLAILVFGFGR